MEQEIQDISIKVIQEAIPQLLGIDNELIIDYTEYSMPNDKHPIHRYPIRFDGLYIGLREKGKARFSINLKEFEVGHNDLVICSPGDLVQANLQEGNHLVQSMMVSSHFLKEMYISLNSFMPFFAARKDHPVFHLTDDEVEEQKTLPTFHKGESGPHTPQLQEKTTTPPKYYTEATLLRAMETAGKTVDDEELRDAMKENGIGRPSTRAAIIEKLFQRKYIVREKKNIHATELGVNLIQTIISPLLKSAELTGRWEKKLREIERGTFTAQQFLDELKQMTSEVVREVKSDKSGMRCPACGKGTIIRGRTRYGCSRWREGCSYAEQF